MPTFIFNKLIRDKLKDDYEKMHQTAVYKKLTDDEYKKALKEKLLEETEELIRAVSVEDVAKELADIEQVLEDLRSTYSIAPGVIKEQKQAKYDKKGGFEKRLFVETLELKDSDEWVEYYRSQPDVFQEIDDRTL